MAMSTSCPVPGWTKPSLVFTVPATFTSLALALELDPTQVSARKPMAEQVLGSRPTVVNARLSEVHLDLDHAQAAELERSRNKLPTSTALAPRMAQPYLVEFNCIAWAPLPTEPPSSGASTPSISIGP